MIYLDNSATTYPKPEPVRRAVQNALLYLGANPGRGSCRMAEKTAEAVFEARRKLDGFFHGFGPERAVFFPSCTAALNQVLFGRLRPGDHVVLSDLEHNAVARPVQELADRGVEFSAAKVYPGDPDATLNSFREALRKNTKLVVCTAASNVWGVRLPVERIAALCHLYEIEICVDAAQAAGVIPLDLHDFDYLCFPAHKGLYGPMGLGVLMLGEEKGKSLRPLIYGGTGVNSKSLRQPKDPPERYESGTLNVPGILGLSAGLDFVSRLGVENIRQAELRKAARIYEGLKSIPGVRLYTPLPTEPDFVPVISFTFENCDSEEAGRKYAAADIAVRSGLHCAPMAHEKFGTSQGGAVRVSPSVFTTEQEIASFLRFTRMAAKGRKAILNI